MEAIIIKNYNKFMSKLDGVNFKIDQRFSSGYWNVKVYSEQLELFLKINDIDFELVEDCYERFK
jgi:hypothetical protein